MTMYDDERLVTLLREVDLPPTPPDRLTEVTRRARRGESRRASVLATVLAVVMVAGVMSALSLRNRSDVQELTVADAVRTTEAAGSARLTMQMTLSNSANNSLLPDGEFMTMSGLADFVNGRYVLKGTGNGQSMEMRIIGKDRWMRVPIPVSFGGVAGKPWLHSVETTSQGADAAFSSVDPTVVMKALATKGTVVSTKLVGDRTRTVLRLPAHAFGQPAGLVSAEANVTVETDSDSRVRLITSEIAVKEFGTVTLSMRYDDFGIEVDVQPPPADQVRESQSSGGTSSSTQGFSISPNSSPADRAKACERIKAMVEQMPVARTEQEKQQRALFDKAVAQACANG